MKKSIVYLYAFLLNCILLNAQITTPVIRANFGIDADLRSNYFNSLVQTGNDDWFKFPGSFGTGEFMIDTNGAAVLLAQYIADPATRRLPFYKAMRFPPYQVINNRLLIDGYFARDYHGDDSTMFASGSNKNGMNPVNWSCPVSQPIPDKNEILDIMLHARRAGPNVSDSLWMIGGVSIENTTGNRYFDFEMYQTDFYYDRSVRKFFNYGPDAGHTTWHFNATGDLVTPGDIIFSAEYSSSALTMLEARIWINKTDLLITPTAFNWSGSFDGDGAGAQFGYAGIQPKSSGAFYTGLQSVNNTWTGAFSLVLGNNNLVSDYTARQFMEFSVNLTKIGLDQNGVFGDNDCAMPFRKVLIKTRSSTSFTSELKDFVAPFPFFTAPKAELETATPVICEQGSISNIYIVNPIATSRYNWSTIGGNIVGPVNGTSINVDTPGIYIVKQYLNDSCPLYATDTIVIRSLGPCILLQNNLLQFGSIFDNNTVKMNWNILENRYIKGFYIEKSINGIVFNSIAFVHANPLVSGPVEYRYNDTLIAMDNQKLYYRLKIIQVANRFLYSKIQQHDIRQINNRGLQINPNPVYDQLQISVEMTENVNAQITINDQMGKCIRYLAIDFQKGFNRKIIPFNENNASGIYLITICTNNRRYHAKFMHLR
jgi:hypothetical protein